jgi:hypothetical protein
VQIFIKQIKPNTMTTHDYELGYKQKLAKLKKQKQTEKISRRYLVEKLEALQTDEFDSSELVYLTDEELIYKIIETAEYYQNEYNNQ